MADKSLSQAKTIVLPQSPVSQLTPTKNIFSGIIFYADYNYQQMKVEIKYADGDLHIGHEPSRLQ